MVSPGTPPPFSDATAFSSLSQLSSSVIHLLFYSAKNSFVPKVLPTIDSSQPAALIIRTLCDCFLQIYFHHCYFFMLVVIVLASVY